MTAKNIFQLHVSNTYNKLTGDKGGIYNLCRFKWFDWCYPSNINQAFTLNKDNLGRSIGPAREEGNKMAQWILKESGKVVPHHSPILL